MLPIPPFGSTDPLTRPSLDRGEFLEEGTDGMDRSLPELAEYGRFVGRNVRLLVACASVGLLVAAAWHAGEPATYTSTTSVLLKPVPEFAGTDPSGRAPREVTVDTDAQLVQSGPTLAAVSRAVGEDPADVAASLTLSAPPLTQVLDISFTASDPRTARLGAATAGRSLIAARREFLGALQPGEIGRLQVEVARLDDELTQLVVTDAGLERRQALAERIQVLRNRLRGLYAAQAQPGHILRAATLPSSPDPTDVEVPLTSGAMLGLLAGCGLGALSEGRQRRRRADAANMSSTSSANRRTASRAPA